MKRLFLCLAGLAVLGTASWADTIRLKDGRKEEAVILGITARTLEVEMKAGGGVVRIPYNLDLIDSIEFRLSREEEALLASTDAARVPELQAWWERRVPYMKLRGCDHERIGAQIVRLLLLTGKKKDGEEALRWIETVAGAAVSDSFRAEIRSLRLSALLQAGQLKQAELEAERIGNLAGADEAAVARARFEAGFVKARSAETAFHRIEKDHPRWVQMPEKVRERSALFHEALDRYHEPVVAGAEERALCARGLWHAAQLLVAGGRAEEARGALEEILKEFPDPDYLDRARDLLTRLNKKTQKETR